MYQKKQCKSTSGKAAFHSFKVVCCLRSGYLPPAPTDTRGTASSDIGGRQSKTNKDFFAEDNELQLQLPFPNFLPAQQDFNEEGKTVKDNNNNNNNNDFDDSTLYDDDYYGSSNDGDEKDGVTNPQLFQVNILFTDSIFIYMGIDYIKNWNLLGMGERLL